MISIQENNVSQLMNNWHTQLLMNHFLPQVKNVKETVVRPVTTSHHYQRSFSQSLHQSFSRPLYVKRGQSTDEYKEAQHHKETDLISQQTGQGLLRLRIPAPPRTPWPPLGGFYQLLSWKHWMAHQSPLIWTSLVIWALRGLFRKPNREDFHRPPSCIQSLGLTDLVSVRCVLGNRADKLY